MRPFLLVLSVLAAAFLLQTAVDAHDYKAGGLMVDHPFAHETRPGQRVGAVYLTLSNLGETPDRLVSASSARAEATEVHTVEDENGVKRMRKADGMDLPPGSKTGFTQGSHHIMLIGLQAPLTAGESFAMTLVFEKAGPLEVMVLVEKPGAAPADHGGHHGH